MLQSFSQDILSGLNKELMGSEFWLKVLNNITEYTAGFQSCGGFFGSTEFFNFAFIVCNEVT